MCGRTCLTLDPSEVVCACKYPDKNNTVVDNKNLKSPKWRSEFNFGRKYEPSYNIAPTDITPVLVSAEHFNEHKDDGKSAKDERVIVPMMWGMVPFWHKGDYKKHGLTTNNCRLEHMLDSKLYKGPFKKGQRCVILCEGFYEWQTTKSSKPSERPAYYLYMKQPEKLKIFDKLTWGAKEDNVNLLKLAGLFDIWQDSNGDKIFSYSVITFESDKVLNWLHHREPAILETDEEVSDWLDFKRVNDKQALKLLKSVKSLCWHQVSNLVNNSRNKSENCNKPIGEVQTKKLQIKSKLMQSWLVVRKRKEEELNKIGSESENSDDELNYQKPKKLKLQNSNKEIVREVKDEVKDEEDNNNE